MPCGVCKRHVRGFYWIGDRVKFGFCSLEHLKAFRGMGMIDPDKREQEALIHAGQIGGQYLQGTGKTGFSELSFSEYSQFIASSVGAYCEKLAELESKDSSPF